MSPVRGEAQAATPAEAWSYARVAERSRARLRDYVHLVKARLSLMVVLSGVVSCWLAFPEIDPLRLLSFTLGTFLVVGGANAFNQVLEREPDARMRRTAGRPLPAGRVSVREAIVAAALMVSAGLSILFLGSGALSGALGLLALLVYVLVYTPLKPRTVWSTLPGAVSGAIPILMGCTAATGTVGVFGWCLFALVFFWQFPHTWAIAATYREDYARAGYRALPRRGLAVSTVTATVALVVASLTPSILGLTGPVYTAGSLLLGALFLLAAVRFGTGSDRPRAAALLASSLFYLPLVLGLAAVDGRIF